MSTQNGVSKEQPQEYETRLFINNEARCNDDWQLLEVTVILTAPVRQI